MELKYDNSNSEIVLENKLNYVVIFLNCRNWVHKQILYINFSKIC